MNAIHEKALEVAARFKRAEADLIAVLQEVESLRVFVDLGFTSLFTYCVRALGLSESTAANFITVSRKAREIPVLQSAIECGELSVSKARKITPVLTLENQKEWIEKAMNLSSRKLEEEVARMAPRETVRERMKFVGEDRLELRLGISKNLQERLTRIQDLESQRLRRAATLEETLEALTRMYLESKDPIKRAERVLKRRAAQTTNGDGKHVTGHVGQTRSGNHEATSTRARHEVQFRDQGRCAHTDERGQRCENRRWLDVHHVCPRSVGGDNSLENLITLCSAHHRTEHGGSDALFGRSKPNRLT